MTGKSLHRLLYAVLLVASLALVVVVVALILPKTGSGPDPTSAPYVGLYEPFDWSQESLEPAPGSAAETVDRFVCLALDERWEDVHALLAPDVAQYVDSDSLAGQLEPMLARAEYRIILSERQLDEDRSKVEFALGDSDGALVLVAEVVNVDGSWYIGQRITLADMHEPVAAEVERYDSEHLAVLYNGDRDRAVETAEALEEAYPDLCATFGLEPELFSVYVVATRGDTSWFRNQPDWVKGGAAEFGIYVLDPAAWTDGTPKDRYTGILRHEFVHYLVYRTAGNTVPTWLNEGLAQHLSGQTGLGSLESLRQAAAEGKLPPVQEVWSNRESPGLSYAASYWATVHLDTEYGPGTGVELVRKLGEGLTWEDAVKQVTGLTVDEFYAETNAYLAGETE